MAGAAFGIARGLYRGLYGRSGPRRNTAKRVSLKRKRRSRYKRKLKLKAIRGPGDDGHLDFRKSHVNIWLSKRKKLYKPLGRWTYTQQNTKICTSGRGQQGVATVVGHLTIPQFLSNVARPTLPTGVQFTTNIFSLNPFQTNTGSSVLSSVAQPTEDKVHCHKVYTDFQMANGSSEPAQVVLYWLLALKDAASDPDTEWNNTLTDYALGQSASTQAAYDGGTRVTTGGTTGYPTYATYGETPTMCPSFRKQYKILKVKNYLLSSGSVEKVTYCVNVNRTFDKAALRRQNNLSSVAFPGATVYLMMIVRGSPVAVQSSGGTTDTVTTGSCEILTTINHTYTFSSLGGSRLAYNRADADFVGSVAGGGLVKLMGELNAAVAEANV